MFDDADLALIEISADALEEPGRGLVVSLMAHIRELEGEVIDAEANAEQACTNIRNECEEEVDELKKKINDLEDDLSNARSDFRQAENDLIDVTFKCGELIRNRDKLFAILKDAVDES